jgi:hypothetical protein
MKPEKIYPKAQRLAVVTGGLALAGFPAAGVLLASTGAKVLCAVVLLGPLMLCYWGARAGLVIDQNGLVDRSLGGPRRVLWQDVKDITVDREPGTKTRDISLITLRLHDGQVLSLRGTARFSGRTVADIRRRLIAVRAASIGVTGVPPKTPTIIWSEKVGREHVVLREADDHLVLQIGDWSTVLTHETWLHHETHTLTRTITIRQPGRDPFVYRYQPSWFALLVPALEATYDRWSAEADDPGLRLVGLLGGTDDWLPRTPAPRRDRAHASRRAGDPTTVAQV